jgi:hypothetical protein
MNKLVLYKNGLASNVELRNGSVEINLNIDNAISLKERKQQGFWSLDFEIDGTPETNLSFNHAYDLDVINNVNDARKVRLKSSLTTNGLTLRGFFVLLGAGITNNKKVVYRGQFIGGVINIFESIPKNLCDWDFGSFTFDKATIDASLANGNIYDGSTPYQFAPFYFGDPPIITHYPVNKMRPAIFLKGLTDQLEVLTGANIRSNFLNTTYARRLTMLTPNYRGLNNEEVATMTLDAPHSSTIALGAIHPTIGTWTTTDQINLFGTPAIYQVQDGVRELTVTVKGVVDWTPTSGTSDISLTGISATPIYDTQTLSAGLNNIEISHTFTGGDQFALFITFGEGVMETGTNLQFCFTTEDPIEGTVVKVSDFLPCERSLDFLNGFFNLFNIASFYNEKTNEWLIDPRFDVTLPTGEFVPGFYRGNEKIDFWKDKTIIGSEDLDFSPAEGINRHYRLAFKEDSRDELVLDEWLYSITNELNSRFPNDNTDARNDWFAPTLTSKLGFGVPSADDAPLVPTMINFEPDDADAKKEFTTDFEARILYLVGIRSGQWDWYSDGNLLTDYPYLVQVDESENVNLGFAPVANNEGLMIFHDKDIDLLNNSFFRELQIKLDPTDIEDLERFFRYLKNSPTLSGASNYILKTARIFLEGTSSVKLLKF